MSLTVTNSHAQLLCNVLFVQLELDFNLIFRFLSYDQITCIYIFQQWNCEEFGYFFS